MGLNAKRIVSVAGIAAAGVGVAWFFRNRYLFTQSDVTTGESPAYPDLRAHVYFAQNPEARNTVEAAIRSLLHWRHVATDEAGTHVWAEVESPVNGFLSDVIVTLEPLGPRHTRVVVRSKSQAGGPVGDLGENARYIRQFQAQMDEMLTGG